jgi:hypothetical protein
MEFKVLQTTVIGILLSTLLSRYLVGALFIVFTSTTGGYPKLANSLTTVARLQVVIPPCF